MDLRVIKQQACTKFRQIEKIREKLNLFLESAGQSIVFTGILIRMSVSAACWLRLCLRHGSRLIVT
jgi:hypothetical protein